MKLGQLARIEVGPAELVRFLTGETAGQVAAALRALGYQHVTLDLQGYRRGSTNEGLAAATVPSAAGAEAKTGRDALIIAAATVAAAG